jgi:hypothetical protein
MSDERRPHTAGDAQDAAPPDLQAIQTRLERDAAVWAAQLPSAERVAARALALAQEPLARPPRAVSPDHARHTAPFIQRGQPPMIASHLRIPLAGVAAALVVVLLGMLLAGRMHASPGPASLPGVSATPTATTPATPTPSGSVLPTPARSVLPTPAGSVLPTPTEWVPTPWVPAGSATPTPTPAR